MRDLRLGFSSPNDELAIYDKAKFRRWSFVYSCTVESALVNTNIPYASECQTNVLETNMYMDPLAMSCSMHMAL